MHLHRSTVGRMLADRLNCPFFEGDDYHPRANKGMSYLSGCQGNDCLLCLTTHVCHADKMHSGIPLEDEDRWPWLNVLADIVHQQIIRYQLLQFLFPLCCQQCKCSHPHTKTSISRSSGSSCYSLCSPYAVSNADAAVHTQPHVLLVFSFFIALPTN